MRKTLLFILSLLLPLTVVIAQQFPRTSLSKSPGTNSENYVSFSFNGSWCWFSDPRAVYYEGKHKRTYTGWVDNYGDIHVAYYDHSTGAIASHVVANNLERDDHNNPSILIDEEGKLLVFFNMHMQGVQPLFLVKANSPENIEDWGEVRKLYLNDASLKDMGNMNHTYTNPVKLSAENGRIWLFWRGIDGKPSYSFSDDNGDTWATGKIFFMPEAVYSYRRPYTKIYSDGKNRIHFCLTDGHPRNETTNRIYYMYYEKGCFFRSNGEMIKRLEEGPVKPSEADLVYDGSGTGGKAWNWDIALDGDGNPVIALVKFPNDSNHIYSLASLQNSEWITRDMVNSGGWFPETPDGVTELEPNYSGGMNFDHESPGTLYLSVKRDSIFEIEKWVTGNNGKTWSVQKITEGSGKHNIRPFAVRGAGEGNPLQVLWMQNTRYQHFADGPQFKSIGGKFPDRFHSSIKMNLKPSAVTNPLAKSQIVEIMRRTADWQLANPFPKIHLLDWHYGAFYTGIRALYEISGEERYRNELINIGEAYEWQPLNDIFHADRLTVIDTWAWLYEQENNPVMIDKSQWVMDIHLARKYARATDVRYTNNPYWDEWWTWCDALFMAPPSFVRMWKVTGKKEYLDYVNTQWWKTSDYLYSGSDSLYFRDDRYISRLSDNGKKIFWARGNGWVIAGLARILDLLPADHPMRASFEQQYREMAAKLLSLQSADGLWRVSLIDPAYLDIGETSGSAFFTFALAWGLNNGLVDLRHKPAVEKAWLALCARVNPAGRLGFVQQVAGDPYPFYDYQWQVYATGAFMLAGKEMYLMKE
jgi:rhamnogalacturonyl hydrolase YesR